MQPNSIPTDKLSALQSAFTFVDFANSALSDNKLSRDELLSLAQLGKNAQAGFQQFGGANGNGPDVTQFAGKFDKMNQQLARGEINRGRENLGGFEASLGNRPDFSGAGGGPNLPGGGAGPGGGGDYPAADLEAVVLIRNQKRTGLGKPKPVLFFDGQFFITLGAKMNSAKRIAPPTKNGTGGPNH